MAPAQPTYSKDVAPIFQKHCVECHRRGDIAPFTLENFSTAVWNSRAIERSLKSKTMPPWKPVEGFGEFRDHPTMTDQERQTVLDWIAADLPEGNQADLPPPAPPKDDWPLGPPDLDLRMLQPYTPPTDNGDIYRCFIIPTGLNETVNISAIDVLPGSRQIVHHVLLFQDTQGVGQDLESRDGQPGYPCFGGPGIMFSLENLNAALAGWAPGQRPHYLPDGIGIPLQKGARIIMQVHYHPHHGTDTDQTRIGLYFSKKPITQRLFQLPLINDNFTIPAGTARYDVNASLTVPLLFDFHVIWVYPHMHLLGREIKMEVQNRDGSVTPLIYEDNWDFNWQGSYTLKEAVGVRSGSVVRLKCTFDNSAANQRNPNSPPKSVGWGEATTDEMCVGFLGLTLDNERILPFSAK
jgi:hypothetical protein